jgi:hypothetical protein
VYVNGSKYVPLLHHTISFPFNKIDYCGRIGEMQLDDDLTFVADSEEQDSAYAILFSSVRWVCRVDVHDEPNGAGTQDLVWQGIDEGTRDGLGLAALWI